MVKDSTGENISKKIKILEHFPLIIGFGKTRLPDNERKMIG
jgi:hypothetical protein